MNYGDVYGSMHARNPKWFSGYSIKPYVEQIAGLVRDYGATRLLDYGCGKGYQYLQFRVMDAWGGLVPHCYDPGVRQLQRKPKGQFDGIICTDVMEHIEKADLPGTLAEIFGYASPNAFAFFVVACRPAKRKRLPDGRDVHVTVKPPGWWDQQFAPFRREGLEIRVEYDEG